MNIHKLQKKLSSEIHKELIKTKLDRLTDENDLLVKSLKKPGCSFRDD